MATQPAFTGTVKVTAKDINGNNVAKQYNNVIGLNFDYAVGKVNVVDAVAGSFYFAMTPLTTLTYTITANPGGSHAVVMS